MGEALRNSKDASEALSNLGKAKEAADALGSLQETAASDASGNMDVLKQAGDALGNAGDCEALENIEKAAEALEKSKQACKMAGAVSKGAFENGLFDAKPCACLKDCILFPCVTSPAINEKVGSPIPHCAALLGPCCGCAPCVMMKYGMGMKGKGEPIHIACLKGYFCGCLYAHQLMKESVTGGSAVGAPSQAEMR